MEEVPAKPTKPKKPVADGVAIIDCSSYFRPFGLTSPWFRRVWFVKDICGLVSNAMKDHPKKSSECGLSREMALSEG